MPIFRTGNMWDQWQESSLFLITTNSTVKKNGRLVMGRGIAQQARDKFPGLDLALGKQIEYSKYGLLISLDWPRKKLGCFQVKYNWYDKADLDLIKHSTEMLLGFIKTSKPKLVSLNFPGIGYGGFSRDLVLPIISVLPDCVPVWER